MADNEVILQFDKPGLHTFVQDLGRPQYRMFGVPAGGVLDKRSAITANRLVGNPADMPVLEIALAGPQITIHGSCNIAVTGAELKPHRDGAAVPMHKSIAIEDGAQLTFGYPSTGCRGYLAVSGEWQIPRWLGSVSPLLYSPEVTPGSDPRSSGVIRIVSHPAIRPPVALPAPASSTPHKVVDVVTGPEFAMLPAESAAALFNRAFTVSKDINRMGIRLEESLPGYTTETEIISSGVVPGTIQLTHSGRLVILLADAQTSGGYPRIGHVIAPDLDQLAQAIPGHSITFRLVTMEDAVERTRAYLDQLQIP